MQVVSGSRKRNCDGWKCVEATGAYVQIGLLLPKLCAAMCSSRPMYAEVRTGLYEDMASIAREAGGV